MINLIRSDQLRFHSEMKSIVTGLQIHQTHIRGDEGAIPVGSANVGPSHVFNGFVNGRAGRGLAIDTRGSSVLGGGGSYDGFVGYGGYGGGGGSGGGPRMWRYRKLGMPIFERSDPDGWLLRVERYFAFYKLSEAEMLESVAVALEGDALRWFQWEKK